MEMTMMEMLALGVIYIMAGVASGLIAGLLGVGGGIVIVPVLFQLYVFMDLASGVQMHLAVGSSLAVIVVTAIQSARAHHAKGAVDFDVLKIWAPAIVFGVICGAGVARFLTADTLKLIFGVLSLVVAVHLNLPQKNPAQGKMPALFFQRIIASLIGFFSALMGIGGGTFSVAALSLFGKSIHHAVGTSAALGFFVALPGALGFMIAGYGLAGLPAWSVGYVNFLAVALLIPMTALTAPMGAKLAHRFSRTALERAFSVFLVLTALRMLWSFFM